MPECSECGARVEPEWAHCGDCSEPVPGWVPWSKLVADATIDLDRRPPGVAISLDEPYATLLALPFYKMIETREGPPSGSLHPKGRGVPHVTGLAVEPGTRVAIHATRSDSTLRHLTNVGLNGQRAGSLGDFDIQCGAKEPGVWYLIGPGRTTIRLGCGELVGEATIDAAYRIGGPIWPEDDYLVVDDAAETLVLIEQRGQWLQHRTEIPIDDEIPYGHYKEGRWGIHFANPERYRQPITAKGAQGFWATARGVTPCRLCRGATCPRCNHTGVDTIPPSV